MTSEQPETEPKAGGEQPANSSVETKTLRRERHTAPLLSVLAIVLALIALAGVGASAWAWYQLRGEQARLALLEGRTSALDGRLAALQSSAASAHELSALQNRVATQARASQSRTAAYAARLNDLSGRLANGVLSYREDEAETLMRLAQTQLAVARDPQAGAHALTLADQVLAGVNEPRLAPVRAALAQEIQALKSVPRSDVDGAVARLVAVSTQVDGLPLAANRFLAAPAAATATAPGWSWHRVGAAFKRAFSPLIVVSHGPVARPLLPPREAYFVRENLKLALASARAALLEHDAASYRASLTEAQHWLATWFDTQEPAVSAAQSTLSQLAGLDLNPPLPQLGKALSKLRAIRAGAGGS
ncbi:MAG: uroporphyrinogen-III C-methyltransferase [Gammaproteobacteria bacterium]